MFKYTMPILIECWPQYWISSRGVWNYIRRGRALRSKEEWRERGGGWSREEWREGESEGGGEK
jgi:hypothetical protein